MSTPDDKYEPRFPPFPTYTGIPYKDFVESGIRLRSEADGIERDGMNVPTVALSKRHEMDNPKTDATNHRTALKHVVMAQSVAKANMPWWQQWEADDAARGDSIVVDPKQDMYSRFQHAAETFTRTKKWPSPSPNNNVRRIWDEFQKFVGLAGIPQTKQVKKAEEDVLSDDDSDDGIDQVGPDPDDLGNQKMMEFLADPAYGLKVFFSTHMKDRGLIWNDAHLTIAPKLISFFVQYIIRNRVFNSKDKKVNKGFDDAKQVIERASVELPLTSKMASTFPDDLSLALKELFRAPEPSQVSIEMPVEEDHIIPTENPDIDAALANAGVTVISTEDVDMSDSATWASGVPTWGSTVADGDNVSTWGSEAPGTGWGSDTTGVTASGWGADVPDTTAEPDWGEWTPPSLFPLLGPTALPLTHTSGYAEFSVRRIKSITPPIDGPSPSHAPLPSSPDPVAVEQQLERQFHKVVLSPWPDWTNPADPPNEDCLPHFIAGSREHVRPHNPATDDITVLVTAKAAEPMGIGMGIGGQWAQIARIRDMAGTVSEYEPAKMVYWYSEGTILTLLSFNAYPAY